MQAACCWLCLSRFQPDLLECDCIAAKQGMVGSPRSGILSDGVGDGDRGCITFDTQAILLAVNAPPQ